MTEKFRAEQEKHELRPNTIVIAGSARLPENAPAKQVFGCLTIELEIDKHNSIVVDIHCSPVSSLAKKMLCNILLGREVEEGIKDAVSQLQKRFSGLTKRAMIAALEDACRRYKKFMEKINGRSLKNTPVSADIRCHRTS